MKLYVRKQILSGDIMEKINLTEHKFEELSNLKYSIYTTPSILKSYLKYLVIAFHGEYRYGSAGDNDAAFMRGVITAALVSWDSQGIILNLRDMKYSWGDMLQSVFYVADSISKDFPISIIVSDLNREGIISLLKKEMFEDPSKWIYVSLEDAINAIEEKMKRKEKKI